jgi:fatty-acyl-CoA synthase
MLPGQMMNLPLTITSVMNFADQLFGDSEIVSVTADNPEHRYTYADAFKRTRQLGNAFAAAGLEEGDRIATLAWNDYRHFELYYAISCSGAVCHTINPRLFPEQIEYIANHAEDRMIFVDPAFLPLLEALQDKLTTVERYVVLRELYRRPQRQFRLAGVGRECRQRAVLYLGHHRQPQRCTLQSSLHSAAFLWGGSARCHEPQGGRCGVADCAHVPR